jgi:DNA adenine methylase
MTDEKCRSFLRWAGGKTKLTEKLLKFLPNRILKTKYWEPFLGGASMFFAIQPSTAVLSDANVHLINTYKDVRDYPDLIANYLNEFDRCNSKEFYYITREKYNNSNFSVRQSARFIYLNKASFNGIFRVNSSGDFNVPYGYKDKLALPSRKSLKKASLVLKKAEIQAGTYHEILKNAERDDFVYLDPPYPPLNGTAYFTHYTKEKFGTDDQRKVAETAAGLSDRGCSVMITNADTPEIRDAYNGWTILPLPVVRWVTCKAQKHKVQELVILNYKTN